MRIAMFTNTYRPHVGGVARSVGQFTDELRAMGHEAIVVAPTFRGMDEGTEGELRIPALQNFNSSDFSVAVPLPGVISAHLEEFAPEIVHAHHPFLLGATGLRFARAHGRPIVFTHHTMYERYTHYMPGDSPAMERFAVDLATGFANLCDHLIAPSESIAEILRGRGVETPITPLPTGVDAELYAQGDRAAFRERAGLSSDAIVVGHLGRLAPEKNLPFLARAVARAVRGRPEVHFLVVGEGPSKGAIVECFERDEMRDRLHFAGRLGGEDLINAYHSMDLFAFASETETQGMVLLEAMAAGVPVVALDAPGAREVVHDGENGRLVAERREETFAQALEEALEVIADNPDPWRRAARRTAESLSMPNTARRLVEVYRELSATDKPLPDDSLWHQAMARIKVEWELLQNALEAASGAVQGPPFRPLSPPEETQP